MIELNLKLIPNAQSRLVFIPSVDLEEIHKVIFTQCTWPRESYYLRCNNRDILNCNEINGTVQVIPRLRGGKGGFGSMLRAIGAQIEKTTNREACRDLSGRRLRDINEEQRLKKWISQQSEREKEIEEKRKIKLEKLCSEPKHEFKDDVYFTERNDMSEKLNTAFEQGLQASTSSVKRKLEKEKPVKKKKKLLIDLDEFSSSDDSEEYDTETHSCTTTADVNETIEVTKLHSEDAENIIKSGDITT